MTLSQTGSRSLGRVRRWQALLGAVLCTLACRINVSRNVNPGEIRGVVVIQAAGKVTPVANAHVALENSLLSAITDSQGGFVIGNLPPATYSLMITATPSGSGPATSGLRRQGIMLQPGSTGLGDGLDLGQLTIGAFGTITGTVMLGAASEGGTSTAVLTGITQVAVATDNSYEFTSLAPGSYTVSVVNVSPLGGTLVSALATAVVGPGGTVSVTNDLSMAIPATTGSLAGLAMLTGVPSAQGNVNIIITLSSPGVTAGQLGMSPQTMDPAGDYSAVSIPPGIYSVTASIGGFEAVSVPALAVGNGTATVPSILLAPAATSSTSPSLSTLFQSACVNLFECGDGSSFPSESACEQSLASINTQLPTNSLCNDAANALQPLVGCLSTTDCTAFASGSPVCSSPQQTFTTAAQEDPSCLSIASPLVGNAPDGGSDGGPPDGGDGGGVLSDAGVLVCVPDGGDMDGGDMDGGVMDGGSMDAGSFDAGPNPDAGPNFCALSGSWVHDSTGFHVVGTDPAGTTNTAVYPGTWLTIPQGFCAHHYATVHNARQIRFAPGGELFVASPTDGTTGGGTQGLANIAVVPDDNHDGYGDSVLTYFPSPTHVATQGILFANGSLYYQDDQTAASAAGAGACGATNVHGTAFYREAYTPGQRSFSGTSTQVSDVTYFCDSLHWPKTLDIADDGTIFFGNGGTQSEVCTQPDNTAESMPVHGGIVQMTPDAGTPTCLGCQPIVKGLRNPIAVKCHHDGHDHCFATELALDYSADEGGREKLITIHSGDNWGYPCCASANVPYVGVTIPCAAPMSSMLCAPDCSTVQQDNNSFFIGNTPFGFDFEDLQFPAPWDHRVLVALHGAAGTWAGAQVVAITTDPCTGIPLASSNISGQNTGAMVPFATGWDDGTFTHGRPADIDFSPDGRMFVANDTLGEIFWIAPIQQ